MSSNNTTTSHKGLIVITGASSGIGAATAKLAESKGYATLVLARRLERLEKLGLKNSLARKVDVTDLEGFRKAVSEAEAKFGPVKALVNNAGLALAAMSIEAQDPKEWERMFSVNVMGVLNGIKTVAKSMRERKEGTIVNVSSVAGHKHFGASTAYCATKFAVRVISEGVRKELHKSRVRVCNVSPGFVETELFDYTTDQGLQAFVKDMMQKMTSLRATDIANSILFVIEAPSHVCIRELMIAPVDQEE